MGFVVDWLVAFYFFFFYLNPGLDEEEKVSRFMEYVDVFW